MNIDFLAHTEQFVFFRWELVVAGSIVVNLVTQFLKKTFSKWYGSIIAIVSSISTSTLYLLYFVIYRLDFGYIKTAPVIYTIKVLFEYVVYTVLLLICCKVGYDTLKCYRDKIEDIFKSDNLEAKNGGNN